ncbi:conserved hypothetical protein [Streptomyces misionensis JCM 4497]
MAPQALAMRGDGRHAAHLWHLHRVHDPAPPPVLTGRSPYGPAAPPPGRRRRGRAVSVRSAETGRPTLPGGHRAPRPPLPHGSRRRALRLAPRLRRHHTGRRAAHRADRDRVHRGRRPRAAGDRQDHRRPHRAALRPGRPRPRPGRRPLPGGRPDRCPQPRPAHGAHRAPGGRRRPRPRADRPARGHRPHHRRPRARPLNAGSRSAKEGDGRHAGAAVLRGRRPHTPHRPAAARAARLHRPGHLPQRGPGPRPPGLRRGARRAEGRTRQPRPPGRRLGSERGPRRMGAGLAGGEGRPLDQPVQLDQHQQLRAVDTPRGRRTRPGNRRLPRATHPVQDEREPPVWPPSRAYMPRPDNAP